MGQRSPLISWWLGSIERGRGRTGLSKCLLRVSPIRPRLSEVQAHPTSTMTWGTKLMTRTCHGGMPKGPRVMESRGVSSFICQQQGCPSSHQVCIISAKPGVQRASWPFLSVSLCPFHSAPSEQLIHREQLHPGVISCQNLLPWLLTKSLPFIPSALQEESASVSFKMRIGILFPPS